MSELLGIYATIYSGPGLAGAAVVMSDAASGDFHSPSNFLVILTSVPSPKGKHGRVGRAETRDT